MIGFYDYTVVLTYLSLLSGMMGIIVCLHGIGHPFVGMFFLMISGLCDTFDGRVARTKKNRTSREVSFGVQIDSLADMVAFGVLPPCVGIAMLRNSERFTDVPHLILQGEGDKRVVYPILLMCICLCYVLAALIRLAYFNMLEEERRRVSDEPTPKYYTGLPVTSSSLIFPTVLLVQFATKADLTLLYFGVMLLTAFFFVSRLHVLKPKLKGILVMVVFGALEFIALLFLYRYFRFRR